MKKGKRKKENCNVVHPANVLKPPSKKSRGRKKGTSINGKNKGAVGKKRNRPKTEHCSTKTPGPRNKRGGKRGEEPPPFGEQKKREPKMVP